MIQDNEHGQLLAQMLPQLLIAMIKKNGGTYAINVKDIDDTGQDLLGFRVDEQNNFIFEVSKKS